MNRESPAARSGSPLALCLKSLVVAILASQAIALPFLLVLAASGGAIPGLELRAGVDLHLEARPDEASELLSAVRQRFPAYDATLVSAAGGPTLRILAQDAHAALREVSALARSQGLAANRFTLRSPQESLFRALVTDPLSSEVQAWFAVMLLPMPVALLWIGRRRRRQLDLARTETRGEPAGAMLLVGLAVGVAGFGLAWILDWTLSLMGHAVEEQSAFSAVLDQGGLGVVAFAAFAVLLAPVGEELFFRGFLFAYLLREKGPLLAYAVSSATFALLHFNPSALPLYVMLGILLSWAYRRHRRLAVPIVAHATQNAAVIAWHYLG